MERRNHTITCGDRSPFVFSSLRFVLKLAGKSWLSLESRLYRSILVCFFSSYRSSKTCSFPCSVAAKKLVMLLVESWVLCLNGVSSKEEYCVGGFKLKHWYFF